MELSINNFKCFYNVEIPINDLTVFAGANGHGKSTALQSLLLLRRTIEHCAQWRPDIGCFEYSSPNNLNVELNNVYCLSLGSSINILPIEFEKNEIILSLADSDKSFSVHYDTGKGDELWITPTKVNSNFPHPHNPLLFQQFYYLNAERIGPRITQDVKFYDYYNVGFQGEFTAQIIHDLDSLESNTEFKMDSRRIINVENAENYLKGSRFQHHVNAWLNYIIDGVTIIPVKDSETHMARIIVESPFSKGRPTFPTNTGFGISYSLPIIVSCLLAESERILIIENPEAHLHPSAQSKIGFFLGVMANAGVKIIVETHSDHILNGIQLAVVKKKIKHDRVVINYFHREEKTPAELINDKALGIQQQPSVTPIQINEKGILSEWPKGFFDQTQVDYSNLIKLRRHV